MGLYLIVFGSALLVLGLGLWIGTSLQRNSVLLAMSIGGLLFGGFGICYRMQAVRSLAMINDVELVLTNWRGRTVRIRLADVIEVERIPGEGGDDFWIYRGDGSRIRLTGGFQDIDDLVGLIRRRGHGDPFVG